MPGEQQYTDAQLSDGRTLRFLGQLGPDEVRQKVHSFRTREGAQGIEANPPGITKATNPIQAQELQNPRSPNYEGEMPGVSEGAGLRKALAGWTEEGPGGIIKGARDIGRGDIARGGHEVISGAGITALPTLPFVAAAAPLATARTIAGSAIGGHLAGKGAEALGANPDQSAVAGDVGSLVGGGIGLRPRASAQAADLLTGGRAGWKVLQ
jgi:hypothetical protein